MDDEGQPKIPRGPAYRWDHRRSGEFLADVWIKYTGKGLTRHNGNLDEDGPFRAFMAAALQAVDRDFSGKKLARQIHEARQERKRNDARAS